MFTLVRGRFRRVYNIKMIDQSFLFNTALAVGCGVGIGWVVRGAFRSSVKTNSLASEVSRRM